LYRGQNVVCTLVLSSGNHHIEGTFSLGEIFLFSGGSNVAGWRMEVRGASAILKFFSGMCGSAWSSGFTGFLGLLDLLTLLPQWGLCLVLIALLFFATMAKLRRALLLTFHNSKQSACCCGKTATTVRVCPCKFAVLSHWTVPSYRFGAQINSGEPYLALFYGQWVGLPTLERMQAAGCTTSVSWPLPDDKVFRTFDQSGCEECSECCPG
jgi:hypothetical protein